MTKIFKINEKPYLEVIFEHVVLFLLKGNFSIKIWLTKTAVALQHLNVKDTESIGHKPKIISSL